jgi:hypothetical protein
MNIFIDQSSKIEYTSQNTVIAYSNGKQKAILIKAKDKREIQEIFRQAGKPDMFVYRTFAVLIYLLIKKELKEITHIAIDKEYIGKESLIKNFLLEVIRKNGKDFPPEDISFVLVGKKHGCHKKAIGVYRGDQTADIIVERKEVLAEIV